MIKPAIIAIVARGGAIGRGGDQPFHISADFRRFKQLTLGHPVIMGRKTFEALPKGALPQRRNIVITRNPGWSAPNVETATSLDAALALCQPESEPFIIGGGEIYRLAMPLAHTLYITEVDADVPDADTFFPPIDSAHWHITENSEWQKSPDNPPFRFLIYSKK